MSGPMESDILNILKEGLEGDRREKDNLLHCSSHLTAPLRHVQLEMAGAPTVGESLASTVRMKTGTLWHTWFADSLRAKGVPGMFEVKLDQWLPEGWTGTADWIIWDNEYQAFRLMDLKTTKGGGIPWIHRDGAKEDHLWQLSAYWHALAKMGIPLVEEFGVFYLPMDDVGNDPTYQPCNPLPLDTLLDTMFGRLYDVKQYLNSIRIIYSPHEGYLLTDALAEPPERVQSLVKISGDVLLKPHWKSLYCPFSEELCPCRTYPKQEKIGHWVTWPDDKVTYVPRKGYEDIEPKVKP
jgi:hypothetical protein